MIPEKKRRVVFIFILIYALFGGTLYYLLLFNSGLTIEDRPNPETSTMDVFIGNKSSHLIYKIGVSYTDAEGNTGELAEIERLAPGEKSLVSLAGLPERMERVEITAEAPFHVSVIKDVVLRVSRTVSLVLSARAPEVSFIGNPVVVQLKICNEGDTLSDVLVEEEHDTSVFPEQPKSRTIETIEMGECRELAYEFTPMKQGMTTIYFNINAYDTKQTVEKVMRVEE